MADHAHKRFSPKSMKKLDAPSRVLMQPIAPLLEALKLRGGMRTIDLGVGTGYVTLPIAQKIFEAGAEGYVTGLDVSEEMLVETELRAKDRGLSKEIRLIRIEGDGKLPLEDGAYDRAIIMNTAHELDNRPLVWSELKNALHKGGFVLIVDWSSDGPFDIGPPKDHRLETELLERELRDAGFETEQLDIYDNFFTIKASV